MIQSGVKNNPPVQLQAKILSINNVAPHHFSFSLLAPQIAAAAQAGQFIHVLPRDSRTSDPLMRRAFSIMSVGREQIDILFRVGGKGTYQLSKARIGEDLDVLGPLGQPFDIQKFHVKQNGKIQTVPLLIGGGVGVPPLFFLGKTLKNLGLKPVMMIGARDHHDVLAVADFERLGIETQVATDDGSLGHTGRVTDLLSSALIQLSLDKSESIASESIASRAVVYACGPLPMLRAVAALAAQFEVPCQVSMEENMPCGIGVCNGCVVAMKTDGVLPNSQESGSLNNSDYGRYRRICIAGPAVWASEVDWEAA